MTYDEPENKCHGQSQLDQSNTIKLSNEQKLIQGYQSDVLEARTVEASSLMVLEKLGDEHNVSEAMSTVEHSGTRHSMHSKVA